MTIETVINFRTSANFELTSTETVKVTFSADLIQEIIKHQDYLRSLGKWAQIRITIDDAEMFDFEGVLNEADCDMFLNISSDNVYFYAQDNNEASVQIESDAIYFPQQINN